MHRERNPLLSAYAMLVYAFLFLPIVVLIIFSFNDSEDNFAGPASRSTGIRSSSPTRTCSEALRNTLEVAFGGRCRIDAARDAAWHRPGASAHPLCRRSVETLILLPMVAPRSWASASALLAALLGQWLPRPISIAHITFCVSYVAVVVRARAVNMDPMSGSRADLGASAMGAFWFVTLPLLAPAIAAGAMLAFALSFDDLIVTTFNAGPGSSTLPLYLYSRIKFGVTPEINAISTIIVAVTCVAILIAWRFGQTRSQALPSGRGCRPTVASASA
jgi:spermidine/putrescine transport system permease protein